MSLPNREPSRVSFPWVGLIALSAVIFLNVTSEMVPTGLLPDMSASLGVSEEQIGLLVTVFAFTVVLTSTLLTAITRRFPRHALIVWVLVGAAVSNAFTAISPSYELVVVSRVAGGMAHGLFWAVVVAYSGHLVAKEHIGRAVSITLAGGTLAFVFGVPLATTVGHTFGWRLVFAALSVFMIGGAVVVWLKLPKVERPNLPARPERQDNANTTRTPQSFRAARGRLRIDPSAGAVVWLCGSVTLIMIGYFSFFTYIAPFLLGPVGARADWLGALFFVYGLAGAGGLLLAGTVLANRPHRGIIVAIVIMSIAFVALGLGGNNPVVAIMSFTVLGITFGTLPPLLQTHMLHTSSERFRDTASSLYSTSFNAGIGTGALVGAALFGWIGVGGLPFFSVAILLIGVVILLVSRRQGPRKAA